MNDNELLLNATLESLRAGESTPALAYADYLEERNRIGPQFFRSLAKQFIDYPDWLFMDWTATDLGGGYWPYSTSASSYILRSLTTAQNRLCKDRQDFGNDWWLGMTPEVIGGVCCSQESRDYERSDFSALEEKIVTSSRREVEVYKKYMIGSPMYGCRLWVFDRDVVPPDCAVILCEQIKVLGLIRECYPIDR